MFLSSVTVGRAFITHQGKLPPDQCPPPGFDSVVGEVRKVREMEVLANDAVA